MMIVGTGNYAWINFLAIAPVCAMFDDQFFFGGKSVGNDDDFIKDELFESKSNAGTSTTSSNCHKTIRKTLTNPKRNLYAYMFT